MMGHGVHTKNPPGKENTADNIQHSYFNAIKKKRKIYIYMCFVRKNVEASDNIKQRSNANQIGYMSTHIYWTENNIKT